VIASTRKDPVARALFVATILVGSFLLFLIQPMVARMALPRLGGAPNVWNSAMLVYQALLLAGYAYAHKLSHQPFRRQAGAHIALMALAALVLPIALVTLPPSRPGWEVLWVPALLALSVGPVFFLVSAQAPLMQRWFASHDDAGEPWALYASSNIGSFAGLIAYPLLLEPLLPIESQSLAWSLGYGLLVLMVALAAWARWHAAPATKAVAHPATEEPVGWRRFGLWLALSAIPSGLMLSTTTHLTTDIFAMPLLWVIPLGLYLLSFVVAFADNRLACWAITMLAPVTVLLAGGLAMVSHSSGTMAMALASVALLFALSVSLHGRLYDTRPQAAQLTLFYLAMSIGGALGGAFTALVAPVLFDWVWEHPLLVLAAAAVMPLPELLKWRRMPGLEPAFARLTAAVITGTAIFIAALLYQASSEAGNQMTVLFLSTFMTGLGLLLLSWRWLFVLVLAMQMLALGGLDTVEETLSGERTRSYFGIYTVHDYPSARLRTLAHGTTLHGQQSTDPEKRREPMTYYGRSSGVGRVLDEAPALFGDKARVGIVGLGTGTLACYRRPGQTWTFFEIDPVVLRFSRNGTFTYLSDCAPDARIALGDARLELEKAPARSLDVLAIDAFSSDAIPLHLMTDEAFGVYLRALADDGVLVVHISNRFIELEPVIAAAARRRGLTARALTDNPADRSVLTPSAWVVLSRDAGKIAALAESDPDAPWIELARPAERAWTDDRASILPFIMWNKLLGKP
jgi:hypothetical protein